MTAKEAKELLSFHSCRNENVDDPRWKNGFLGSLRPFKGRLDRRSLDEVIECLRALREETALSEIDRTIVSDMANIIWLGKTWAGNELTSEQKIYLKTWIDIIDECGFWIFDAADDETAFLPYREYLEGKTLYGETVYLDGKRTFI